MFWLDYAIRTKRPARLPLRDVNASLVTGAATSTLRRFPRFWSRRPPSTFSVGAWERWPARRPRFRWWTTTCQNQPSPCRRRRLITLGSQPGYSDIGVPAEKHDQLTGVVLSVSQVIEKELTYAQ